jgi:glycosyltransferase involved in cell wall biosynthesis
MFLYSLNPAAGVEQYVVSVLPELRKSGVEVIFCVEQPPEPRNQYLLQLQADGFDVHYPHLGPFPIRGWSWFLDLVLWLVFPLTIVLLFSDRVVRGRQWGEAYIGLRGRLNNITKQWLPGWLHSVPIWLMLTWMWIRYRPALIHVLRADSVAALEWSLRLKRPTVYTEALEPDGPIYYPQLVTCYLKLSKLARKIPVIVTQSVRVKNSIEEKWGAIGNVRILPWVVAVRTAAPQSSPDRQASSIVFGSAGRLSSEKSIETFLDAANLVLAGYPDRVSFVVAGSGPAENDLKAHAAAIGLNKQVQFTGRYSIESMPYVFGSFDVFVISSLTEGAPLAVMEAMAYGKPVIATDVAGTGELVVDEVTGFLVNPQDPQGLARACEVFLVDPGIIDVMGQAAVKRYHDCYAPVAGARSLHNLYVELLNHGQS